MITISPSDHHGFGDVYINSTSRWKFIIKNETTLGFARLRIELPENSEFLSIIPTVGGLEFDLDPGKTRAFFLVLSVRFGIYKT